MTGHEAIAVAADPTEQVIIVAAARGATRAAQLEQLVTQTRSETSFACLLSCDLDAYGPWAGLSQLCAALLPQLEADAPDLIRAHDYELASVLPALRRTLEIRNPTLTDVALEHEKVRNYPADRALRIVHGLVDLMAAWQQRCGIGQIVIGCDDYDRAGLFVQRFFAELVRRRMRQLGLTLIVAVAPEVAQATHAQLAASASVRQISLNVAPEPEPLTDRAAMRRQAEQLEAQIGQDSVEREILLPQLIRAWRLSDQPEKALRHIITSFAIYTKQSLYEDALSYGRAALAQLEQDCPDDLDLRWHIVSRLYFCYAGLRQAEAAKAVLDDFMARTENHEHLMYCCYFMAIIYARLLPQRDLALAEEYLEQGLVELSQSDLPEHTRVFQTVFNRNGLALVRHFQGRFNEAIELCETGYAQLQAALDPQEHRLHRSVLLYNIAQVYSAAGVHERAISYFTATMEMDPNYSEYYNDRGNIYLKLGQLDLAMQDYRQAIELSPPYPEVWTNIGQCYRLMDDPQAALSAYDRALDLDPYFVLALNGRAEAHEQVGSIERALVDYEASLLVKPDQPLILANRAVLAYGLGRLDASCVDLDRAITLAPQIADLYQNRAVALAELGRIDEAIQDLQRYLALSPEAEDRVEVAERLAQLQAIGQVLL